jgi:pimeloyl-ACP methyl ester carboxylesterase
VESRREAVILIHGLWMRGPVFFLHQRWLSRKGYDVRLFSYPSVKGGMRENAEALGRCVASTGGDRIHLAGHSLGGLLILALLARQADPRLRRVVLMGSPCMGCHAATTVAGWPWVGGIVGHTLKDWLASPRPHVPASIEAGVLAGNLGIGLGRLVPGLPKPSDGVVAVAETRLPEATDAIVLPVSHAGMLVSRACAGQVAAFLESGSFLHD